MSNSRIAQAVDAFDWKALSPQIDGSSTAFRSITDSVRRSRSLLIKYPSASKERKRTHFLAHLRRAFRQNQAARKDLLTVLSGLRLIETGYRAMLAELETVKKSCPPAQAAAACARQACVDYRGIMRAFDARLAESAHLTMPTGPLFEPESDQPTTVDGAIEAVVSALSMNLTFLGDAEDWAKGTTWYCVPTDIRNGVAESVVGRQLTDLAVCWRRWHHVELQWRFQGGGIRRIASATTSIVYEPAEAYAYHWVAAQRLEMRLMQALVSLASIGSRESFPNSVAYPVALLPRQAVSQLEVHAATVLESVLCLDVTHDAERYGGLRIVEWLRGYSVMQILAEQAVADPSDAQGLLIELTASELRTTLRRCGMSKGSAQTFISNASFGPDAEDLFDAPIVRRDEGLLLFAPAARAGAIPRLVMSVLSRHPEKLLRKGTAFEDRLLSNLRAAGLKAERFNCRRNGEQFEYDVLAVWDGLVLVVECKNHVLPVGNPIGGCYFDESLHDAVRQVKRLGRLARTDDTVLREALGITGSEHTIIECVVHCAPYSQPPIEDVPIVDLSGLTRFFEESSIDVVKLSPDFKEVGVERPLATLWTGARPTGNDLRRYLQMPTQYQLLRDAASLGCRPFPVGSRWLAKPRELFRRELQEGMDGSELRA